MALVGAGLLALELSWLADVLGLRDATQPALLAGTSRDVKARVATRVATAPAVKVLKVLLGAGALGAYGAWLGAPGPLVMAGATGVAGMYGAQQHTATSAEADQHWSFRFSVSIPLKLDDDAGLHTAATTPDQQKIRTYRTTTASVINPERGFRSQLVNYRHGHFPAGVPAGGPFPWPDPRIEHAFQYNMTVVQTYCYLDSEVDELNASFVDSLDAGFERHRQAGIKSLFRFAYDSCGPGHESGEGNYTTERILKHIAQLTPVIKRNADVIFAMYAGVSPIERRENSSANSRNRAFIFHDNVQIKPV